MRRLVFSPAAEADIESIWDYSADNWGEAQADRYIEEIRETCIALASGGKRGSPVDIRPDYLKRETGSHMLYYRDLGDMIVIIRVLHSAQDVQRHL